jgi:endonuclease/exonuclease/phosphatase family metal-dependent hydrolase
MGMDGRIDLARIAATLRRAEADIIALQEVESLSPRSGMKAQASSLADKLGMNSYFAPSWELWPIWKFGNAILARGQLYSTWNKRLSSRGERRGLSHGVLRVGRHKIHIYCTHWGLSSKERIMQAEECFWQISSDGGKYSVVCGDFNAESSSPEVKRLSNSGGWRLADVTDPTFPSSSPRTRIDHILVSSALEIERVDVPKSDASDHLPVVVRLRLVEG